MDELPLTKELYVNLLTWMRPKYASGTIIKRSSFLHSLFKDYPLLNHDTLKKMMRKFKYQHQRACLCMINRYCYDTNIPFHIIVPGIKAQAKKLPDILSPAEIRLMIESAPKPYNLAIRCIFNMGAGLRVSEIIKMNWQHIRWVDWINNKDHYGVAIIKAGKGSKDRVVNIPKKLMQDLYDYAAENNALNEFRIPMGGSIFGFDDSITDKKQKQEKELMSLDLEKFKDHYLQSRYDWFRYHIVKKYCEKALGKRIKIHSLRHSRATYLYEVEKVPVEKIQVLLGHSSLNTTMLYTKINPLSTFKLLEDTKEI